MNNFGSGRNDSYGRRLSLRERIDYLRSNGIRSNGIQSRAERSASDNISTRLKRRIEALRQGYTAMFGQYGQKAARNWETPEKSLRYEGSGEQPKAPFLGELEGRTSQWPAESAWSTPSTKPAQFTPEPVKEKFVLTPDISGETEQQTSFISEGEGSDLDSREALGRQQNEAVADIDRQMQELERRKEELLGKRPFASAAEQDLTDLNYMLEEVASGGLTNNARWSDLRNRYQITDRQLADYARAAGTRVDEDEYQYLTGLTGDYQVLLDLRERLEQEIKGGSLAGFDLVEDIVNAQEELARQKQYLLNSFNVQKLVGSNDALAAYHHSDDLKRDLTDLNYMLEEVASGGLANNARWSDLRNRYQITDESLADYARAVGSGVHEEDFRYLNSLTGSYQNILNLRDNLERQIAADEQQMREAANVDPEQLSLFVEQARKEAEIRQQAETNRKYMQQGVPEWLFGSLVSMGSNILSAPEAISMMIKNAGHNDPMSEDYRPYSIADLPATVYTQALREGGGEAAGNVLANVFDGNEIAQKAGNFLYGVGMSIADSAALVASGTAIFTAAGLPLGAAEAITLSIMGGSAASNTAMDAIERGATNDQAAKVSLAAGVFEAAFEKLSLNRIFEMKYVGSWSKFIKETAKQAGIEGSEEMFTEIANICADTVIMGDKSSFSMAVQQYRAENLKNGMGYEEADKLAKQLAWEDLVLQVGEATLGGLISGGVMGGFTNYNRLEYTEKLLYNASRGVPLRTEERLLILHSMEDSENLLHDIDKALLDYREKHAAEIARRNVVVKELTDRAQGIDGSAQETSQHDWDVQKAFETQGNSATFVKNGSAQLVSLEGRVLSPEDMVRREPEAGDKGRKLSLEERLQMLRDMGKRQERRVSGQVIRKPGAMDMRTDPFSGKLAFGAVETEQFNYLDKLAKAAGINIYIVDTIEGHKETDGLYYKGDVYITESALTKGNELRYTAVHEVTHSLKDSAPEQYQRLVRAVEDEVGGRDILLRHIVDEYARYGIELSQEEAVDESVAISLEKMADDPRLFQKVADMDYGLASVVFRAMREWLDRIRNVLSGFQRNDIECSLDAWRRALSVARRSRRAGSIRNAIDGSAIYRGEAGTRSGQATQIRGQEDNGELPVLRSGDGLEAGPELRDVFEDLTVDQDEEGIRDLMVLKGNHGLIADPYNVISRREAEGFGAQEKLQQSFIDDDSAYSDEEEVLTQNNGPRFRMRLGMSDEERTEILKDKKMIVPEYKNGTIDAETLRLLGNCCIKDAKKALKAIAEKIGVMGDYENEDVGVTFNYSNGSFGESLHKQIESNRKFINFAKMLTVMNPVIEKAVEIMTSKDRYEGTLRDDQSLKEVHVFVGAFFDDEEVIPVLIEAKEFLPEAGRKNKLHVVMTVGRGIQGIKKEADLEPASVASNETARWAGDISVSMIRLADLIHNVNRVNGRLLKFFPDQMLTEEQRLAKAESLRKQEEIVETIRETGQRYREDSNVRFRVQGVSREMLRDSELYNMRDMISLIDTIPNIANRAIILYNLAKKRSPIENSENYDVYYDILFYSMRENMDQYLAIYLDMLGHGFDADDIQRAMEMRIWNEAQMKWKTEGEVTSTSSGALSEEWEGLTEHENWSSSIDGDWYGNDWLDLDEGRTQWFGSKSSVSTTKEAAEMRRLIADQPYEESIKEDAMEEILEGSAFLKYMAARNAGISTYAYVDLIEELEAEANRISNKKSSATSSINEDVVGPVLNRFGLTRKQKSVIWHNYCKTKGPWD